MLIIFQSPKLSKSVQSAILNFDSNIKSDCNNQFETDNKKTYWENSLPLYKSSPFYSTGKLIEREVSDIICK